MPPRCTFKGPGQLDSPRGPQSFIGATSTDFLVFDAGPFLGVPDWDSWTTVSASLSGAVKGKTKAFGQPTGGWDTCSPPT